MRIEGYAYGGDIAKWINEFLERDNLDLVVFGDDMKPRHVIDINELSNEANENDYTIYVDYSPYMIISQASLDDLNKRFVEKNEKQLSMRSFRPNFIASGCEPYAEVSKYSYAHSLYRQYSIIILTHSLHSNAFYKAI